MVILTIWIIQQQVTYANTCNDRLVSIQWGWNEEKENYGMKLTEIIKKNGTFVHTNTKTTASMCHRPTG